MEIDVTIADEGLQNLDLWSCSTYTACVQRGSLLRATPAVTRDFSFWGLVGRTMQVLVAFYNNQEVYCGLIQNRIPHAVIIYRLQTFWLILDAYDCGPWEGRIFIVLELMWYSSDDGFAKPVSKACLFLGSAFKISDAANGPLDLDPLL